MPGIEKLIAYRKACLLYLKLHPVVARFPQNERFTLGQRIENSMGLIIELIVRANMVKGDRIEFFKRISLELDLLLTWVKIAKDLQFMGVNQYGYICTKQNEIAKMCTV